MAKYIAGALCAVACLAISVNADDEARASSYVRNVITLHESPAPGRDSLSKELNKKTAQASTELNVDSSGKVKCKQSADCTLLDTNGACISGYCTCKPGFGYDVVNARCTMACKDWCEGPDPLAQCSPDGKKCNCISGAVVEPSISVCVSVHDVCQFTCYNAGATCTADLHCKCPDGSMLAKAGDVCKKIK